jgi:hypothetical protein
MLAAFLGVMIVVALPVLADPPSREAMPVALDPGLTNVHPETGEVVELAPGGERLDEEVIILRGRDDCEYIGSYDNPVSPVTDSRFRGNVFRMEEYGTIDEFSMELTLTASTELTFYVFEALIEDVPVFTQIWSYTYTPAGTGRAFYSSGPIMDPEPLGFFVGKDYALAVAWQDSSVGYGLSVESGPKPFSKGTIRGGTSLGKGPDDIGDTETLTAYSGGFYSMEICFLPDPGACCIAGVCDDTLTETECLYEDGEFAGPLTVCGTGEGEIECPLDVRACCLDSECTVLTEYQCTSGGGIWHAEELDCSDPCLCGPCGACCVDSEPFCLEPVTQDACENTHGGVYRGDGSECADYPGCNAGACCFGEVCVPALSEATCVSLDGRYQGPGSNCEAGLCVATGCCCFDDGSTLSDVTEAECDSFSGHYRGDYTDCATVEPPCGEGACCTDDYGCLDLSESLCWNPFFGDWQGEGTTCRTISPHCEGTCCWLSDCNVSGQPVTPEDCTTLPGGAFVGYDVGCYDVPDPCESPVTGACCLPGEACVMVGGADSAAAEAVCDDLNDVPGSGAYQGDGSVCPAGCGGCLEDIDCEDGNLCTTDTCNQETGQCEFDPVVCPTDGVACTLLEFCNEATGECAYIPDDSYCDNGVWCDGAETCDAVLDCQVGTDVDCDDGVACTVDSCNENTDSCDNIPDDNYCDNGLWCDGFETCDAELDCLPGVDPCPGLSCDEVNDECISEVDCATLPDAAQCFGDSNGDGLVNTLDVGLVGAAFGMTDDVSLCKFDVNCDGEINTLDVGLVEAAYGDCATSVQDPCWME